jgi:hypothetical protein
MFTVATPTPAICHKAEPLLSVDTTLTYIYEIHFNNTFDAALTLGI